MKNKIIKSTIVFLQMTAILFFCLIALNVKNSSILANRQINHIETIDYMLADTIARVRHYVVPHTKVKRGCPECGDLQKIGTMDFKEKE